MIEFKNVYKWYNGRAVIEDLSLKIKKGSITVVIGSSGSGKSTTLKMINRLVAHDKGKILFSGEEISNFKTEDLRRRMGYAIQSNGLFPHWTVADNIATVPRLQKWSEVKITARVNELLEVLGLDPNHYRERMPHQLSGGQQQRVGVARAMAADPEILLMDEPFGALDPVTRHSMQQELKRIHKHYEKTILVITHDIDEALYLADHLILMDYGKIIQQGSPIDILRNPCNDFVKDFIGRSDIGLKMLSLEPVNKYIRNGDHPKASKDIKSSASLKEALSQFITDNVEVFRVINEDKKVEGHLIFEDLLTVNKNKVSLAL